MLDEYHALLKGKMITEDAVLRMILTDIGSSFYSYMIMLEIAERKVEAARMTNWRKRVFQVRDNLNKYHIPKDSSPAEDIEDMRKLYAEMEVLVDMLVLYRAGESPIFHSSMNTLCGIPHYLADYYLKNPPNKE